MNKLLAIIAVFLLSLTPTFGQGYFPPGGSGSGTTINTTGSGPLINGGVLGSLPDPYTYQYGAPTEYAGTSNALPAQMCTGSDGFIYTITNTPSNNTTRPFIIKTNPATGVSTSLLLPDRAGGSGADPTYFYILYDICLGPDGNIWAAMGHPSVYQALVKVTPGGVVSYVDAPNAGHTPRSICVGPDHNLWLFCGTGVWRYNVLANSFTSFPITDDPIYRACVGPDNKFWYGNASGYLVSLTTSGTETVTSVPLNAGGPILGPDNQLWVPEPGYGGSPAYFITMVSLKPDLTVDKAYQIPNPFTTNYAKCSGPDGCIYISANDGGVAKIYQLTMSGTWTTYSLTAYTATNNFGCCVGPDGNIWFSEQDVNKIGMIPLIKQLGTVGDVNSTGVGNFGGLQIPVSGGYRGTGTLVAGTVTIANSHVSTGCMVILIRTSNGANSGTLSITNKNNGVGFTASSTNASDTGTFDYLIIK